MEPEDTGVARNPDGTYKPGVSGNPAGKPPGAISVIAMIRKKFQDNPDYFKEWVDKFLEDKGTRVAVMEALDGKAKQPVEVTLPDNLVAIIKHAATKPTGDTDISE